MSNTSCQHHSADFWKTTVAEFHQSTLSGSAFCKEELFELAMEPFGIMSNKKLDLIFSNIYIQKNHKGRFQVNIKFVYCK
jgi:hypothetical protein